MVHQVSYMTLDAPSQLFVSHQKPFLALWMHFLFDKNIEFVPFGQVLKFFRTSASSDTSGPPFLKSSFLIFFCNLNSGRPVWVRVHLSYMTHAASPHYKKKRFQSTFGYFRVHEKLSSRSFWLIEIVENSFRTYPVHFRNFCIKKLIQELILQLTTF